MRNGGEAGFTIIELLVVMAIIAVLAAIGIPQYGRYKQKAYDRAAQAVLREVAIAMEAYFLDHDSYTSCDQATCPAVLSGVQPIDGEIELEIVSLGDTYSGSAQHNKGTGEVFNWNS